MMNPPSSPASPLALALVCALPLVLAACGAQGEAASVEAAVRDSAGVQIVENGPTPTDHPSLQLRETRRIGVLEGDPRYQFDDIANTWVDPEGNVWVAGTRAGTVRIFDARGAFVRELGGLGEGPGEVPYVAQTIFTDSLMVFGDYNKTLAFTPEGELRGDWQLRQGGTFFLWGMGPQGWVGSVTPEGVRFRAGEDMVERFDLRVVDPDRREAGPVRVELPPRVWLAGPEGMPMPRLFAITMPVFEVGPGGRTWVADSLAYEVRVHGPDGRLERIVRKAYQPAPMTDVVAAMRARNRRLYDSLAATGEVPAEALQRMRTSNDERLDWAVENDLPPSLPAVDALLVDREGAFWVGRRAADGPTREWDRFGPDGRWRGRLLIPEDLNFRPFTAHDGQLTGVLRDELDVPYVVTVAVE